MTTFSVISVGALPNDGTGDGFRDGGLKINSNFLLAAAQIDTLSKWVSSIGATYASSANLNDQVGSLTNLINVTSAFANNDFGSLSNRLDITSVWVQSLFSTSNPAANSLWINSIGTTYATSANLNDRVGSLTNLINITSAFANNDFGSLTNRANITSIWVQSLAGSINVLSTWINSIGGPRVIQVYSASTSLTVADAGKILEFNTAAVNTLTIFPFSVSGIPVGTQYDITQINTGQTNFAVSSSNVTLRGRGTKVNTLYSFATLYHRAVNDWVLGGDLA